MYTHKHEKHFKLTYNNTYKTMMTLYQTKLNSKRTFLQKKYCHAMLCSIYLTST